MDTKDKKGPKPSAATAFLALQPAIEAALKRGIRLNSLHQEYREALGISYVQFTRYVRRHITGNPPPSSKPSTRAENVPLADAKIQTPVQTPVRTGPISTPSQTPRKFEFDPTLANRPGRDKELF
jgi:hypothetical protein